MEHEALIRLSGFLGLFAVLAGTEVLVPRRDSNHGFALSIWDRLFGSCCARPREGHQGMITGLQWQDGRPAWLLWSLALPFTRR